MGDFYLSTSLPLYFGVESYLSLNISRVWNIWKFDRIGIFDSNNLFCFSLGGERDLHESGCFAMEVRV